MAMGEGKERYWIIVLDAPEDAFEFALDRSVIILPRVMTREGLERLLAALPPGRPPDAPKRPGPDPDP